MMDPAQSVLQRAPPADLEKNVKKLSKCLSKGKPDEKEALLKRYQLPFRVLEFEERDVGGEKDFIACRSNRVGSGEHVYRSPWTNKVYNAGHVSNKMKSSQSSINSSMDEDLYLLQSKFNGVWEAYKNLYYGHDATGSVYLSESESRDFQGFFCISKKCDEGSWNSMHIVTMDTPEEKTCNYKVSSTVLMVLDKPGINTSYKDAKSSGEKTTVDISALLHKEVAKECSIQRSILESSHIENIGKIIEANELELRSNLERVDIPNVKETLDSIQKEPERPRGQVNPLVGLMMGSDVFQKRKAAGKM